MQIPETLFDDLSWGFYGSIETSFDEFCKEVLEYQREVAENDSWDPTEIVLSVKEVKIVYTPHFLEDDRVVDLTSESDAGFSAGELLYKLHIAVVEELEDRDHHFLEGLTLNSLPVAHAPAVFILRLGG